MKIRGRKVLTASVIGGIILYALVSITSGAEEKFAPLSIKEYQSMISHVKTNGIKGDESGTFYKYLVYDISPVKKSRRFIRIVEFVYSYPPWEGVNITVTNHVNYDDGSRLIASLHMDDADLDALPDSIIHMTTKWAADGSVIKEDAQSWSVANLHPAWEKYLLFIYNKFKGEQTHA